MTMPVSSPTLAKTIESETPMMRHEKARLMPCRLSIEEHEMLYILDRGDDGWWKVKKKAEGEQEDGETGLVPANYVQEVHFIGTNVTAHDASILICTGDAVGKFCCDV